MKISVKIYIFEVEFIRLENIRKVIYKIHIRI